MSRRYIARNPDLPFADALLVDDKTLYISGRIGFTPGTRELPADIEAEATSLMQDLKAVLAAAGMTLDDLVTLSPSTAPTSPSGSASTPSIAASLPARCRRVPSSAPARCSSALTSSCRASLSNPDPGSANSPSASCPHGR
jgi:hypothetical protein